MYTSNGPLPTMAMSSSSSPVSVFFENRSALSPLNRTNDNSFDMVEFERRQAILAVMSLFGLLLNPAFLVWMYQRNVVTGRIPRILITNLSVSDILLSLCQGVQSVMIVFRVHVPENVVGTIMCKLSNSSYLKLSVGHVTGQNMILLTLERYMSVVHPVVHRRYVKLKVIYLLLVTSWLLALLLAFYQLFRMNRVDDACVFVAFEKDVDQYRTTIYMLTFFLIPLLVVAYCSTMMILKLRQLRRSIAASRTGVGNQQEGATKKRIFVFTMVSGVVFVLLLGPDAIFFFVHRNLLTMDLVYSGSIYSITTLIFELHIIFNPILNFITLGGVWCKGRRRDSTSSHSVTTNTTGSLCDESALHRSQRTPLEPRSPSTKNEHEMTATSHGRGRIAEVGAVQLAKY